MRNRMMTLTFAIVFLSVASSFAGGRHDGDRTRVTTLKCKSKDWGYNHCASPGRIRGSRVAKQISKTPCVKGDNWDTDPSGLWVDRGCAAKFEVKIR